MPDGSRSSWLRTLALALLLLLGAPALVQAEVVIEVPKDGDVRVVRDPTTLGPKLEQAFRVEKAPEVRKSVKPKIPDFTIRAVVQAVGKSPEALIEIKGHGLKLVREGMKFSLSLGSGESAANISFSVVRIGDDEVEMEIPEWKERFSTR